LNIAIYTTQGKNNHQDRGLSVDTIFMAQHGTRKEINQEVPGGIPTPEDDIKIEQKSHGSRDTIRRNIRVTR